MPWELAPPSLVAAQPQAVIDACGAIAADTTWSAGNVYTAHNCNVIVNPAVTLTIQAGAIVKIGGGTYSTFDRNAAIVVKGALIAQGTEANPVIFTSWRDDAHGGDTNGDGPSAGSPGEWYGLHVLPNGQADLTHTQIRYAGSGQFGRWDNTAFTNYAQITARDATLSLEQSEVAYGLKAGIALYGAATQARIESSRVISNTGAANNALPGAIHQDTINMTASYRNLTLAENVLDGVSLNWGAFTGDVTLDGGPLLLYPGGILDVPDGRSLILQPGTLLRFSNQRSMLRIQPGGHLTATGTLEKPVIFAPLVDEGTAATGQWGGISVEMGASANFDHAQIRDAGSLKSYVYAGLWLRSSDVTVRNTLIHDSRYDGLRISQTGTQATLENVTLRDNVRDGLLLNTKGGQVAMNGGAITGNGRFGVWFAEHAFSGEEKPQDQTLTLNGVAVRENAQAGLDVRSVNSAITLQDTAITNHIGPGIQMHPDNDTPVLVNATITGNNPDGVALLNGVLAGERRWGVGLGDLPIVLRNVGLTIRDEGVLTLEPGVTVRAGPVGNRISVQGNGHLEAVGTPEQPIRFLGLDNTPGRWGGFVLSQSGSLTLQHCEIAYGGRDQSFGGAIHMLDIGSTGPVYVDTCEFHSSWGGGIGASAAGDHVIRNSRIGENVWVASTVAPPLDARYNWWGHASGPRHTTLNPAGQGVNASGPILFTPWLTESPIPSQGVDVTILGPKIMAAGQIFPYVLTYANHMTETLHNPVLMARLPALSTYRGSTDGGHFWPERHQVYWELDDLAPGAKGEVLVYVRYQWGIPSGTTDSMSALLAGDNFNADLLDLTPYRSHLPLAATQVQSLSQAEWDAHRAARADLDSLHGEALSQGYLWASAERVSLNNGKVVMQATFIHSQQRWVRALHTVGNDTRATTYMPQRYTVHDTTGGMSWDIPSGEQRFWGSWDLATGAAWPGARLESEACAAGGAGCCLSNCLGKVALTAVAGKLNAVVGAALTAQSCYAAYQSGGAIEALANCVANLNEGAVKVKGVPILGELAGITECVALCAGDPNSNDCTEDLVTCEPAWYNVYRWLGVPNKTIWRCKDGCFSSLPEFLPCPFGECCMPGVGCTSASGSDCKGSESYVARDPNEKYGPAGDLLPGEWVDYRIEYENVGEASAFGVFISDKLHEAFDDTTLRLGPSGQYFPSARLILWDIGELDPVGQPGATGEVTLTVRLRDDLPGGTIVTNQATVYFPSVPEETPTSALIHRIQPAVAEAQSLTTPHATPIGVTLTGREVSSAALTYRVMEEPLFGTLSGVAPNLTYTPMDNFAGTDSFAFAVNNGSMESDPAQVLITVTSAGDTTPPTVLWSDPIAGGFVPASAGVAFTDTVGPLYAPAIAVGFSEALDPATVIPANVTLTGSGGPVAIHPVFDGGANQIVIWPRVALAEGEYTVTVATGVTDLAGNRLASPFVLRFTVGEPPDEKRIYLPAVQK